MLYSFFWVKPQRLNFMFRHFAKIPFSFLPIALRSNVPKRRHINFRLRRFTKKERI